MRILLINHFPLTGSGSGTYTRNVAVSLKKLGHEVCIIFPENETGFERIQGIKMHPVFFTYLEKIDEALPFNFPCFTIHPRSTATFGDLSKEEATEYMSAFEKAIEEETANFKPDVIHGQHIWLLSLLGAKMSVPTVLTAHGTDLMGYQKWERFVPYAKEAVQLAKGIVTISKDTDELVQDLLPESIGKTQIITNGYDTEIFYPEAVTRSDILAEYGIMGEIDFLVMFAGKLTGFKGIDVLLDAAKLYEKSNIGTIATCIAGDGELMDNLKKQAEKLNLQNVYFLGHVDHSSLRKLYNVADVSVVPSRREPFGLVAIEALACGTPVVATNEGGLADIITAKVGTLVAVDDAKELAEGILKELRCKGKEQRREAAASYARENYSQEKNTEMLLSFYKKVLESV